MLWNNSAPAWPARQVVLDSSAQTASALYALLLILLLLVPLLAQGQLADTVANNPPKQTLLASKRFQDGFDVTVWLMDMSQRLACFITNPKQRLTLLRHIYHEARRAQLK